MRTPDRMARRLWAAVLLLLAPLAAPAGDIDYDGRRAQALRPCDEHRHHGRVREAQACYTPLLRAPEPMLRAEAAFALGDLRTANELFREAVAAAPRAVLPRLRWGRMYLAAELNADAAKLFQEALELDAEDVQARMAMVSLGAAQFNGDVSEELEKLLDKDPNLTEAHLVAARVAIEGGHYDEAVRAAQRAERLATQQGQPPLEAYAMLAAIEVVRNRNPDAFIRQALDYNPRYGALFEQLGHFEIIRRRYREADAWLQRAASVQPDLWSARRELGLNLMRLGRIDEARPHLVASYEGDPFNSTTVNTLRLLDSLGNFEMVRVAQPAMNLQLHKQEVGTLGPYVRQLTAQSIREFSQRYGHQLTGPVTVELYPNHDDFAVRTAGLPGIGLLGVTFGHLVAMDSPSGRKSGDFHWGSTLWHEMAHVFTLSVTDHRVPRWLSEGLSVYEEWTSGPTPGVAMNPALLDKFAEDALLPVATLDDGFMRPTYENQVQISYDQAGLVCLFAADRFGFPKVVEFLRAFREDIPTEAAIRQVFQISAEQFDTQFQAFMKQRFATYLGDPKRWKDLMARSHAMLESQNWSAAREAAQAAILILPEFTSGGSAYEVLATAEEKAGNKAAAIAAWQAWRKAGGWSPAGLRSLGALLMDANRPAEATEVLASVNYVDPFAIDDHDRLGQLLIAAGRGEEALREYQVLLALQPLDTAAANFGMARSFRLTGDATRARRHLLESLETAPNYRPAQRLLLEMTGDRTP